MGDMNLEDLIDMFPNIEPFLIRKWHYAFYTFFGSNIFSLNNNDLNPAHNVGCALLLSSWIQTNPSFLGFTDHDSMSAMLPVIAAQKINIKLIKNTKQIKEKAVGVSR